MAPPNCSMLSPASCGTSVLLTCIVILLQLTTTCSSRSSSQPFLTIPHASAAASSSSSSSHRRSLATKRPPPPPRPCPGGIVRNVIVVGAGISGIAAAHNITLSNGRCFKVTVLEARQRVGGRMWTRTETVGGRTVKAEMGAQWLHTPQGGNPITALVKRFNLPLGYQTLDDVQYTPAGTRYKAPAAAVSRFDALVEATKNYAEGTDADVSLDSAFKAAGQAQYLTPFAQSRVAVDFEFEYGAPTTRLSAWYYEDSGFSGEDAIITSGYDTIPKKLWEEAQKAGATIRFGFAVNRIVKEGNKVKVTGNTAAGAVTVTGDVVIVTVPLGVLKKGSIQFTPDLSAEKKAAIGRVGFGKVNKIFFWYPSVFWPTNIGEHYVEESLPANRGRWPAWVNLLTPWQQTGLEGVAMGEYAERMTTMTDSQVIADAAAKVKLMFPGAPASPTATWLQRWDADPYALGAYSFAQVGIRGNNSAASDFDLLGKSEQQLFLFAGEHTHGNFRSTVHGAYLTGIREARRVLTLFG